MYGCVSITTRMQHLDDNEMHGEKARWEWCITAFAVLNKLWKHHLTKQWLLHMDTPVMADQLKLTYINSVRTLDGI